MPSQLGEYTLLRTLGSGANSKVKFAQNKEGRNFAVKILKKGDPRLDKKFLELVLTEVNTMRELSHPNIVNLIEFSNEGVVQKRNGAKENVIYIVLELATGGELFDYVATTGKFSEKICRFYFRQLLAGLEYVHNKGMTHRDLKPENVLFDSAFNLKIADFGFAAPIEGKDGSGTLKTKLGTESYMAPEIHMRKPYSGASVDLFASAIILFIMVTQHPPFTRAEPSDPFYRLLAANRSDLFWKAHSKNKPEGFFSEEFKQLITSMLSFDPSHRPSLQDVVASPWVANGPCATLSEIQVEFAQRKAAIDEEARQKQAQKEQERTQQRQGPPRQAYKGAHRGEGDEEEKKGEEDANRQIEEYIRVIAKNTEFFSTADADTLLYNLEQLAEEAGYKLELSKDKYKCTIQIPNNEEGAPENDSLLEMVVKILKVDNEKLCVEFTKGKVGDKMHFFDEFKRAKEYFGDLVDAVY